MYSLCKSKVEKQLLQEQNMKISFTTDIWTCSHNNEAFISWTAHWIDASFDLRHAILNVAHFPGKHTGERIKEMLIGLIETWKLQTSQVHLVISDNAANMLKGLRDGEFNHVSCFIHNIQLVVNNSLSSQRTVSDMITISKKKLLAILNTPVWPAINYDRFKLT